MVGVLPGFASHATNEYHCALWLLSGSGDFPVIDRSADSLVSGAAASHIDLRGHCQAGYGALIAEH